MAVEKNLRGRVSKGKGSGSLRCLPAEEELVIGSVRLLRNAELYVLPVHHDGMFTSGWMLLSDISIKATWTVQYIYSLHFDAHPPTTWQIEVPMWPAQLHRVILTQKHIWSFTVCAEGKRRGKSQLSNDVINCTPIRDLVLILNLDPWDLKIQTLFAP